MSGHVLIVDDDELVRTGLASNLVYEGFNVLMAGTARDASEMLAREPVDLVLCDLVLEEGDGLELLTAIRERWPHVAVVVITGHGSVDAAMEAVKRGASDFLQKPINPDELVHRIHSILDTSRLRRTLLTEREKAESRQQAAREDVVRSVRHDALSALAAGVAEILRAAPGAGAEALKGLQEDLAVLGRPPGERTTINLARVAEAVAAGPKVRLVLPDRVSDMPVGGNAADLEEMLSRLLRFGGLWSAPDGHAELRIHVQRSGRGGAGDRVAIRLEAGGRSPGDTLSNRHGLDPFQLRKPAENGGLDLAIVRRIAEEHAGLATAGPGEHGGLAVTVELPLARGEASVASRGNENILVLDDQAGPREEIAAVLRRLGYRVVTAEDPEGALRLIDSSLETEGVRIDLVVLDLVLGVEHDGVEIYRRIVERCPGLKGILASGFADTERISEAIRLGMSRCLRKPLDADEVARVVREELDSR